MNILYHHRTQAVNAEGVHIRQLIRALEARGHCVYPVSPPGISLAEQGGLGPKGAKPNRWKWVARHLPAPVFELMELLYNGTGYRNCARACRGQKIELVYERFAFFCRVGLTISRRFKVPLFLEVNYTTTTPLFRAKSKLFLPLARRIERECFMAADALFVVSSFLRDGLISMGIPTEKIFLTPNAVDEKVFAARADGAAVRSEYAFGERKVIGYVGAFFPWHGLDFLLDTIRLLEKTRDDMCVFLVGNGPMENVLREYAVRQQIKTPLIFAGTIPYEKLPAYIAAMDVCVLPDSNNYGSPMKLFEYMAGGRPALAPKLSPMEDVVTDGVNGVLFPARDGNAFAACLEKLLDSPDLRQRIGDAGRRSIEEHHYWKHNAQTIERAYERCKSTNQRVST